MEPYPEGKLRLRPGEELAAGASLTSVDRKSKAVSCVRVCGVVCVWVRVESGVRKKGFAIVLFG